ncbi:MAG: hypothetical protein HDT05_03060 [Bacteroidales bacterium]|nr:hypothetical protein [Bacteroidales bacterium]
MNGSIKNSVESAKSITNATMTLTTKPTPINLLRCWLNDIPTFSEILVYILQRIAMYIKPPSPKSGIIISREPKAARLLITLKISFSKNGLANFAEIDPSNMYYPIFSTSRATILSAPALLISIPYIRINASTTVWPPLVVTGLLKEFVTTCTDIPGSIRTPLEFFDTFVVILKSAIFNY